MILVLVIRLGRPGIHGMETVRVFKAPFVLFYKSKPIRKDTVYFYLFIGFLQGTCQFSVENDLKRFKGYNVANLLLHMQPVGTILTHFKTFIAFSSLSFGIFFRTITYPNTSCWLVILNFNMGPPGFYCTGDILVSRNVKLRI